MIVTSKRMELSCISVNFSMIEKIRLESVIKIKIVNIPYKTLDPSFLASIFNLSLP